MAKNVSPIFKFQGTIGGITFVKSRRYKPHVRASRGTYKPVELNKTMKKCKDQLMQCNKQAKLIFHALRDEHHDGSLWSRLLSAFFKRAKAGLKPDTSVLAGLECDKERTLKALLDNQYDISIERAQKKMRITVTLPAAPEKNDVKELAHYRLHVIAIFPAFVKNRFKKEIDAGPMTSFDVAPEPVVLEVPAPSATAPYVLLLGITGYVQQKDEVRSYTGLAVVKTS
jgi:hypothetical protein